MTASTERPTIRQVAEVAGVSHITVSRVVNGHPMIKDATRSRVLAAIDQLGYRPNIAARTLATQRSQRIGLVVDSASEFGPTSTVRAIEYAAREAGYSVSSVGLRDEDQLVPQDAVTHLIDQGVDAVCLIAPRSSSLTALRKIPIRVPVLVIKADRDPTFLTVSVDQQSGTSLAVDHLAALGHRDILHVAGPLDWFDARARERAFHRRAKAWGMRERAIVVGDWTADFGYDFAKGLDGLPEYTGMFVANDEMALGVIHGLNDNGIRIPEHLSIVGFDDLPVARHFLPPLTTVRQDFHALGLTAVDVLRAALEGRDIPQRTKIPAELIVRESTAVPRA